MASKDVTIQDHDYQNLVKDLKSIIEKGHYEAYKAVDNIEEAERALEDGIMHHIEMFLKELGEGFCFV
ncbi:MAG: DUF1016 family protein, partial [Deltaproteobacteria bacterium]|nr:DUF1016 family protein [Deltaproteobacteria bacterium]